MSGAIGVFDVSQLPGLPPGAPLEGNDLVFVGRPVTPGLSASYAVPASELAQQLTSFDAPNGVAGLDASGRVSAQRMLATGATIDTSLAAYAARVVDLADYAPTTTSAADGAVNGTAFSSVSVNLSAYPVGTNVLIRGAGAGGISFQTTIAAPGIGGAVTLAAAAPTALTGARFYVGQDATTGVRAAYARAQAMGLAVRGRGAYWLSSQSSPIDLSYTSTQGDGGSVSGFMPYTQSGLVFVITSTASAPFSPGVGAHFGAAMFWPAQDGSAPAPLVYPAAFDTPVGGLVTNFVMSGATIVNAYRMFSVEPGGNGGRIFVTNTRAFCLDRYFDIRNGLMDTIQTDNTVYFGTGVYSESVTGNHYLQSYAAANAEVFHLDPAGTGSTYGQVDGLLVNGGIFQGMRYAVRVLSGLLDVSYVTSPDLDSVSTALSVEGNGGALLAWTGGSIYSNQFLTPTTNYDVFLVNTSNELTVLLVSGVTIPFTRGNIIRDAGFGMKRLTVTGNDFGAWGQSTTTGATYYAVDVGNNTTQVTITGNGFNSGSVAGNASSGILLGGTTDTISGNTFTGLANAITLVGTTGTHTVVGNTVTGTIGTKSLYNLTSGTATVVGNATMNSFDKP